MFALVYSLGFEVAESFRALEFVVGYVGRAGIRVTPWRGVQVAYREGVNGDK